MKKVKKEKQIEDAKLSKLETEIEKHFSTLQRNFNSALIKNEYGGIDRDNRKKEFLRFLRSFNLTGNRSDFNDYDDFLFNQK